MIKFIISGYRYWDQTNGNSYYLTTLTSTVSGRAIEFYDDCPGNVASMVRKAGYDWSHIFSAPQGEILYREWQRKMKFIKSVYSFNVSSANIRGLSRQLRKAA